MPYRIILASGRCSASQCRLEHSTPRFISPYGTCASGQDEIGNGKKSGPKTISGPPCLRTLRSAAGVELEGIDSRVPIEGSVGGDVLRRIIECAVVGWVDGHRAVIAPTAQAAGLAAVSSVGVPARM